MAVQNDSRGIHARLTTKPMFMLKSNKSPPEEGIYEALLGTGVLTWRQVVDLKRNFMAGSLRRIIVALTQKVGGQPATLDFHVFSTDDTSTSVGDLLESAYVIYSNTGNTVNGNALQLIINDVRPEEIDFTTNGRGTVQVVIVLSGGGAGGTTDYEADISLFGDIRG